jgi:hypothetical protein
MMPGYVPAPPTTADAPLTRSRAQRSLDLFVPHVREGLLDALECHGHSGLMGGRYVGFPTEIVAVSSAPGDLDYEPNTVSIAPNSPHKPSVPRMR